VASQRLALLRVLNHLIELSYKNGLLSVKTSMTDQLFLHAGGRIPECGLVLTEFGRQVPRQRRASHDQRPNGSRDEVGGHGTEAEMKLAEMEKRMYL
jgi:hypothetical protein